jgi:hypothetical protein
MHHKKMFPNFGGKIKMHVADKINKIPTRVLIFW